MRQPDFVPLHTVAGLVLLAAAMPVAADVIELPLAYNFNGMVHSGEADAPDDPDGFRAISDRALNLTAGVPAAIRNSGAGSGLTYLIVDEAGVLDIVHLGDRDEVDGGTWDWDSFPDGDNVGIQPNWLPETDQTGPQVTMIDPPITLGPGAEIGLLYNYSNGGGTFDVTLGFVDGASVTVTVHAPDWFGVLSPTNPGDGVRYQARRAVVPGTGATDRGLPDNDLNVVEAVIDAPSLVADLGFNIDGRQLNSISFSNASSSAGGIAIYAASVLTGTIVVGNEPPLAPTITEPQTDNQILNAADVHMEASGFSDPDGDSHFCSNWEIWTVDGMGALVERVWSAACVTGLEKVHIHLGDGAFEGSLTGATQLLPETDHMLRVRFRDDSGDPISGWSEFSQRPFTTGPEDEIFAMLLDDVIAVPGPTWNVAGTGDAVSLPDASPNKPFLQIESPAGDLLARFDHSGITNPPALPQHVAVRIRVSAGSAASLQLGPTNLVFTDDEGLDRFAYLPAISLSAGQEALFWVSTAGATYFASQGQMEPDFSSIARDVDVPWQVEAGFVIERVATGFQLPVNIAFVPNPGTHAHDPVFYVTELYGTIKVYLNDGHVQDYVTGLINFNPTGAFPGSGEQGLSGIVVDPDNGDVYVALLHDHGGPHYPRVIRLTSLDGGVTAATQTTILDMIGETQGQSHQISNLSFGPDGLLYVHMGDGFDASTGQNLNSFRGKILRMNKDGTPAAGNPFLDLSDGISSHDYIYASGFRNPFGGAWREQGAGGGHYIVENGPSVDRMTRLVAGRNYLWDGSNNSMRNFALHNWEPSTAPVNCVFIQPSTFNGSTFPPEKQHRLFIAESGPTYATGPQDLGKRITEWNLAPDGTVIGGPTTLAEYIGAGKATCVALAAGPDGLYFSDFYKDRNYASPIDRGASIWRIRPEAPACAPDRDGDMDVDVFDLLDFLDDWFAGCD